MISKDSIEQTYSFFHQKWRVYAHSASDVQRDEIECAISSYVQVMNADLYAALAQGRPDYLLSHATFAADIAYAVEWLEARLG